MKICTFFGHADAPETLMTGLRDVVEDLITNKHVEVFHIGVQGAFDRMALQIVKALKEQYPHIRYHLVLPYHPVAGKIPDAEHTILPEGVEKVPKRFAISYRNRWMIKQSQYVITYVVRPFGGAAKFKELTERQKKTIIEIAEQNPVV